MKNKPTLHDRKNANNSLSAGNGAVGLHFKLGLDVDLRHIVAAIQCERSLLGRAQKFSRAQLLAWVKEKIAQGHAVHTVYECCGFGYSLHEELVAAGARSLVTTPMRLNLERRRKNDRMALSLSFAFPQFPLRLTRGGVFGCLYTGANIGGFQGRVMTLPHSCYDSPQNLRAFNGGKR